MTTRHVTVDLFHPLLGGRGQDALIAIDVRADFVTEHAAKFIGGQVGGGNIITVILKTETVLFGGETEIEDHFTRRAGFSGDFIRSGFLFADFLRSGIFCVGLVAGVFRHITSGEDQAEQNQQ